jgi:hypothetical protein
VPLCWGLESSGDGGVWASDLLSSCYFAFVSEGACLAVQLASFYLLLWFFCSIGGAFAPVRHSLLSCLLVLVSALYRVCSQVSSSVILRLYFTSLF